MSSNLTWAIENLDCLSPSQTVYCVHYAIKTDATEADPDGRVLLRGSVGLQASDLESPGYVPFDQLTETVAVNWIKEAIGSAKVTEIEDSAIKYHTQSVATNAKVAPPWLNESSNGQT
jgi:hypothetical protein